VSDARWIEVELALADAVGRFSDALAISQQARPSEALQQTILDNALMHTLQNGHHSAEAALLKTLDILGETAPTGPSSHHDLINRAALPIAEGDLARPAIIDAAVAEDLHETRRFRHVATHGYANFDAGRAAPTLAAAERLIQSLPSALKQFKAVIDPDDKLPDPTY
jgi:hypothetical protein